MSDYSIYRHSHRLIKEVIENSCKCTTYGEFVSILIYSRSDYPCQSVLTKMRNVSIKLNLIFL